MIRHRDIFILAVITVVSVLLSLSLHSNGTAEAVQQTRSLLENSQLRFDNIQKITLRRNKLMLTFERIDGIWWQQQPFVVRMDVSSMLALIEAAQGVQVLGTLTDSSSLPVLGLGEDGNMIELSDDSSRVRIRLGRKTLAGRAYASLDGSSPVLVDQSLHRRAIDLDHRLWRDIRIFPDFAIDGDRIERVVDGDRLLLERIGGRWEMREPASARVDQNLLTEWVGQLASTRVGSFVVDEPTDLVLFGLRNPAAFFAVSDRRGVTHKLLIGGRVSAGSEDRYVMIEGQPVVFTLRWAVMSQFFPVAELLVDGTASGVSRFDAKRITIRMHEQETILERDLEHWIDPARAGIPVDSNTVDALLNWILNARPTSVGFGQYPRNLEVGWIIFEGYDLLPLDTVRIARDELGQWILENGDNVLRIHPPEAGDVLHPFMK